MDKSFQIRSGNTDHPNLLSCYRMKMILSRSDASRAGCCVEFADIFWHTDAQVVQDHQGPRCLPHIMAASSGSAAAMTCRWPASSSQRDCNLSTQIMPRGPEHRAVRLKLLSHHDSRLVHVKIETWRTF